MSAARIGSCFLVCLFFCSISLPVSAEQVVAFWGFADDYDFPTNPNKQDFAPDVDGTVAGNANLQAFLGREDELDDNGGGGFLSYTSPTSGITYAPTRTIKWDDLKGGGGDFDIGGVNEFMIDKNDGAGPALGDFGNDALMYITLDGTGLQDFSLRFDIEATPGDLPESFDVFYRIGGSGTWFRETLHNNISLLPYTDHDPIDPDNQYASSSSVLLPAALNGQSQIELIVSDFAETGNGEMEIDNFEIIATSQVPEPSTLVLLALGTLVMVGRLRNHSF